MAVDTCLNGGICEGSTDTNSNSLHSKCYSSDGLLQCPTASLECSKQDCCDFSGNIGKLSKWDIERELYSSYSSTYTSRVMF